MEHSSRLREYAPLHLSCPLSICGASDKGGIRKDVIRCDATDDSLCEVQPA